MKITHKDNRLEERLGKRVRVIFKDNSEAQGVIVWNEKFTPPRYLMKAQCYYLLLDSGCYLGIRKSYIKRVVEI